MKQAVTFEILCNNFPCISTFPCVRLKVVAMAYMSNSQHHRATLRVSCLSLSVSLTFQKYFLVFVLLSVDLIHLTFAVFNKSGKRNLFWTILSCLEPFCPREMDKKKWISVPLPNKCALLHIDAIQSLFRWLQRPWLWKLELGFWIYGLESVSVPVGSKLVFSPHTTVWNFISTFEEFIGFISWFWIKWGLVYENWR